MYKEIIVETTTEGADFVSDAFFSLGASGVKIIDPSDVRELIEKGIHWDYIEDSLRENQTGAVKVSGFVSEEECLSKMKELKEELSFYTGVDFGSLHMTAVDCSNENWLTEWKKYYKPIDAGQFIVVPEWISYVPGKNRIMVKIDPTMAFGTGEHESTRLCLQLLSETETAGKNVIDVGTGSGILGIAAAKKGAGSVYMCDIDSLSIQSARENAALNGVEKHVIIEESDLLSKAGMRGEVILANLTADILIRLSDEIGEKALPGAMLICSGIIHSRKEEVIHAFKNKGFTLRKEESMGEWDALLLEKDR